ncbi:GNAT family N-acetyltransferase [Glycomyces sp. NRRL B-16210]|uniref:GNAT family N-acetyltransferase n=1 Tax=Glycomyces sp. NRRL B-16210 TaxID=1463821 RepID=UPI0004C26235|nr:GNAT family N-acetyltransferase [Glycomyces sp. NRRL B-16210]
MTVEVTDAPDRNRYEARIDGELAGFAEYVREAELITFTHTEVDDAHKGSGTASALARFSLDAAREAGLRVRPDCKFYARWIGGHPAYADLVDDDPGRE